MYMSFPVIYNSEEGFQHLTEEGRATMERLNQMLLAGQQQRESGAGDADIAERTDRMHITNGEKLFMFFFFS